MRRRYNVQQWNCTIPGVLAERRRSEILDNRNFFPVRLDALQNDLFAVTDSGGVKNSGLQPVESELRLKTIESYSE